MVASALRICSVTMASSAWCCSCSSSAWVREAATACSNRSVCWKVASSASMTAWSSRSARSRSAGQLAVRGGADERLAAPLAAHPAGKQVLGGVAGPLGVGVAALVHQRLDRVEGGLVDQRLVPAGVPGVTEEHLAEVDAVAQHGAHGHVAPGLAGLGAVAVA